MADLASQPTSIQSLYTLYREKKLFVNRRYQRKLVWTLEEKQKLIGSILRKYPIPAILIAERASHAGTYEIIDGLQRLHSIVSFIENAFPLDDGRYFDVNHFPTALAVAKTGAFDVEKLVPLISAKEVSTILDYTLALSVMRNAKDTEVNDVFDRINTYGHRLSDQERRQAGVENEFSSLVRSLACVIRGDASADILDLREMPSISIDLPKTSHGYEVKADEVFWVQQGILRSTSLRDSLDEQCIADIVACIVGGSIIERSKDALDQIYTSGSPESERIINALEVYGAEKVSDEIKYCIDQLLKVSASGTPTKLRDLIFGKNATNEFPALFAVVLIAMHETIVGGHSRMTDPLCVRAALDMLVKRIDTSRGSTASDERRKNIDTVKGLLAGCFVTDAKVSAEIYGSHNTVDVEAIIRRSEIETPTYELKQGILKLEEAVSEDAECIDKVVKTASAIANIGPKAGGKILIGVTDKKADADRIKKLDGTDSKKVGKRYVVGVNREAKRMGLSVEQYFAKWREGIKNSSLSEPLKSEILSNLEFNSFFGMGLLVISVPPQGKPSYVGDEMYWRNGDTTELAKGAKLIADIAARF